MEEEKKVASEKSKSSISDTPASNYFVKGVGGQDNENDQAEE